MQAIQRSLFSVDLSSQSSRPIIPRSMMPGDLTASVSYSRRQVFRLSGRYREMQWCRCGVRWDRGSKRKIQVIEGELNGMWKERAMWTGENCCLEEKRGLTDLESVSRK